MDIKFALNRATNWLINKQCAIKEPKTISVTLDTIDPENKFQVLESIKDPRNIPKLLYTVAFRDQLYFTPNFIKTFDHHLCSELETLKYVTRFLAVQIGVFPRSRSIVTKKDINGTWECVHFKCGIGSTIWHEQTKIKEKGLSFKTCPFFIEYTIELHPYPAIQISKRYKLTRYVSTHSHPLNLAFDICSMQCFRNRESNTHNDI